MATRRFIKCVQTSGVADNLRVKEVVVGEGERRRRYVGCHNPQEEARQRAHRRQILRALEAELASLKQLRGESHSKRVCQLRASRRYGRYLRLTKGGLLRIDVAKRRAAEQLDGKFVVHSNDDSLSPADVALFTLLTALRVAFVIRVKKSTKICLAGV